MTTPPDQDAVGGPIGRRVQWGALWMLLNTGAAKILGVTAQIGLGWLLSQDDFALYAIAISVTSFTNLLSDNGLRNFLIQRQVEYEQLKGPVFWLALTLNFGAAAVLTCLAPILAETYKEPALQTILLAVAVTSVLATPNAVLSAKLRIALQFRTLSLIQIFSALIRCIGMVALAWFGFGALSFVLPVIASNLCESAVVWWITRSTPWTEATGYHQWPQIFGETKWILVSACSTGIFNNGLYFALGFFVPKSVIGIYYFAYQFVVQIGLLLSHNLFQVLFPAFSQLTHDAQRARLALERSLQLVMWLAAPTLGIIAIYGPLQTLIWHGKWEQTVQPVQFLCIFYPITVVQSVVLASQAAAGRFRQMALMMLMLAAATIGGGIAGAFFSRTASGVAVGAGFCMFAGTILYLSSMLKMSGIATYPIFISLAKKWTIAVIATGISLAVDHLFLGSYSPAFRIMANGVVFVSIFAIAGRIVLANQIVQAAEVMPIRIRTPFLRLMRLSPLVCAS